MFMECRSRRRMPVQDNAALEAAYAKVRREPGGELLVRFEARYMK
jgi:hypothetical protein